MEDVDGGRGGDGAGTTTVRPAVGDHPLANPLTGLTGTQPPWPARPVPGWPPDGLAPPPFAPPPPGPRHPYASVVRWYVPWDELESSARDPAERLREYADRHWAAPARLGVRVVPRVYLDFPQRCERRWPADLAVGAYDTPEFERRAVALVEKMGAAWGDDPRLAWVETGIVGLWGEHHDPAPSDRLQQVLGDAFDRALPGLARLRRYPEQFRGRGWGLYWDSFGCTDGLDDWTYDRAAAALVAEPDMWRHSVVGGEVAFDFMSQFGATPDEAVTRPELLTALAGAVRRFHATALGWVGLARYEGAGRAGLDALQRALGYRFVVVSAAVPRRAEPGGALRLRFSVRNDGSAPFLRDWPVRAHLVDLRSREVVQSGTLAGVDVRRWLPGDGWDDAVGGYRVTAAEVHHDVTVELPAGVPAGTWLLALSVDDPATGRPALRFANTPYLAGGLLPLAPVGVGVPPDRVGLRPDELDDVADDPLAPVG